MLPTAMQPLTVPLALAVISPHEASRAGTAPIFVSVKVAWPAAIVAEVDHGTVRKNDPSVDIDSAAVLCASDDRVGSVPVFVIENDRGGNSNGAEYDIAGRDLAGRC